MKNRISISEVSAKLGYPSGETIQGLRLLRAFVRLSPSQRSEVVDIVEQLASDPAPAPGGTGGGRRDSRQPPLPTTRESCPTGRGQAFTR